MPQQRCYILGLPIRCCRFRRSPVSAPVVPHGVKFLAQRRPNVIPHRRVRDAIVNQHDGARPAAAFLVIQLPPCTSKNDPGPLDWLFAACCDRIGVTQTANQAKKRMAALILKSLTFPPSVSTHAFSPIHSKYSFEPDPIGSTINSGTS